MKASQANKEFYEKVNKYHGLDSLLAIGLFIVNIILYALLAIWESKHLIFKKDILLAGSGINVLMIIISVLFVSIKHAPCTAREQHTEADAQVHRGHCVYPNWVHS